MSTLRGKILFEPGAGEFHGATVYLRLEDVTRADASALPIAHVVLQAVSHLAGSTTGPEFRLQADLPDPGALYAVRVHIDVDGDGRLSQGDFISMQSYPVLTRGHPDYVELRVGQI